MDLRETIKNLLSGYIIIYGGSMLATLVFCLIFDPEVTFGIDYFEKMLLFTLAGDLPILIFYSSTELNEQQWKKRFVIHFIVLSIVLLSMGGYFGLYETCVQAIFFEVLIAVVYVIVKAIIFVRDIMEASKINERLQEMRGKA